MKISLFPQYTFCMSEKKYIYIIDLSIDDLSENLCTIILVIYKFNFLKILLNNYFSNIISIHVVSKRVRESYCFKEREMST